MDDLDLDLVGIDEVVAGHTEAARSDLLDRGAAKVAVLIASEAINILTTFYSVRLARGGSSRSRGFMCFFRNRSVGRCTRLEALHDGFDRLDFLDRNRLRIVDFEIHRTAKCEHLLRLIVDDF